MDLFDYIRSRTKYTDRHFLLIYVLFCIVGIIAIASSSSVLIYQGKGSDVVMQILYLLVSILIVLGVQLFPTKTDVKWAGYVMWGLSIFFLLWLFAAKVLNNNLLIAPAINGERRWIHLGITFQPSEMAKLGLTIVVADMLSKIEDDKTHRKYFRNTLVMTAVTVLLIAISNLSTAILLSIIILCLWIIGQVKWKYIIPTVGSVLAIGVILFIVVEFAFVLPGRPLPHTLSRAESAVARFNRQFNIGEAAKAYNFTLEQEEVQITDKNRQEVYANVAITRGFPFGVGPGNSKERDYLPLAFSDFIFAIIVEESGLLGAGFLMLLYLSTLFRSCVISTRYEDRRATLMVMGLALMFTLQALISMAVSVGIIDTGQPLPLISKGGTSVLFTATYFGIMMGVSLEQSQLRAEEEEARQRSREDIPDIE